MRLSFIHTADWQLGRPFGNFDEHKRALLRDARLTAIDRIADAARAHGAAYVLVAGDVFDSPAVSDQLLRQTLARLVKHLPLVWHLLPGNHDPVRAGGVWERAAAIGLPANVLVHTSPTPAPLGNHAVLLPAPLTSSASSRDPTAWMDDAATPAGLMRIGLAHGSVQGFGSEGQASQQIAPTRARTAGLAYLALGDWHGTVNVSDRVWYAGTPEPDRHRDNDPGNVLAVGLDGPRGGANATPIVEKISVAAFRWTETALTIEEMADWDRHLEVWSGERMRFGVAADRQLVRLVLKGAVTLAERAGIDAALAALEPSLFHLEVDDAGLLGRPGDGDGDIWSDGTIQRIAQSLGLIASSSDQGQAEIARLALRKLVRLDAEAAARSAAEGP